MPGAHFRWFQLGSVSSPVETASVVLLDIEGTTTPIDFVYKTLFPFAREQMARFMVDHFSNAEIGQAIALLEADHAIEKEGDKPKWERTPEALSRFALWLMDRDRKATGLKALQGLIWKDGYETGELQATLYEDVAPAIHRWTDAGKRVCIYSSGSVLAQKLLFKHTTFGDLTDKLSAYFDTTTGPKRESTSYLKIAEKLGVDSQEVLFFSDIVAELDAATVAGCRVGLVVRDDPPDNPISYPVLRDFQNI